MIFVVQCNSSLAPSRRRRVSELRWCTFFSESRMDISLNLSKTANWKKKRSIYAFGCDFFNYVVDIYFVMLTPCQKLLA